MISLKSRPVVSVPVKISIVAATCGLLSGCAAFYDSAVALNSNGPTSLQGTTSRTESISTAPPVASLTQKGPVGAFELSYARSEWEQEQISAGLAKAPKGATEDVSVHARQMALDGVNLVDTYCADFFRTRGDDETFLNVAKDATASSGTLASGVLSLVSPANAVAAGAISLVTSTASNTLDVYTKNFLFGSDNIESVHTMTVSALAAHRKSAFPANDNSVWDFGGATTVIMDHQDICTPASIRSLVLSSVSSSSFKAVASTTPSDDTVKAAAAAAAGAAPEQSSVASVAPDAVSAASPKALDAAKSAVASGGTSVTAMADAMKAATDAVAPVVQSGLQGTSQEVQKKVTSAIATVVAASAVQAAKGNTQSPDRHLLVKVSN